MPPSVRLAQRALVVLNRQMRCGGLSQSNENLSPAVAARIMKEIRTIIQSPPEGIKVSLIEDNITNILGEIEGPVGTPFEGGLFKCKLVLGQDFPQHPPKGTARRALRRPYSRSLVLSQLCS